jgi:hypothetical protein
MREPKILNNFDTAVDHYENSVMKAQIVYEMENALKSWQAVIAFQNYTVA